MPLVARMVSRRTHAPMVAVIVSVVALALLGLTSSFPLALVPFVLLARRERAPSDPIVREPPADQEVSSTIPTTPV